MNKDDGGTAFPGFETVETYSIERGEYVHKQLPVGGMSLRDYFAGQVLAGLLANYGQHVAADDIGRIAQHSYALSDAMLAERSK